MKKLRIRKLIIITVALSGVAINAVYSVDLINAFFNPNYNNAIREIVISAIVLEIGWIGLLISVISKPFERRHILLLTIVPILLGNILHGVNQFEIHNGNPNAIALNTVFGLLYAGLYCMAFRLGRGKETMLEKYKLKVVEYHQTAKIYYIEKVIIMERNIGKLFIAVILIFAPQTIVARDFEGSESGLSGSLQVGAYFLQTSSQLYAENSNRDIDGLDGPADSYDEIEGLASIFLRYQFEGGTALYAGNPLEIAHDFALSAGVIQPLSKSTLDVALAWLPINDVWKNPYQLDGARDRTNMDARGLRIKWQEIAGSPWEVIYNIDRIDIDNDEIGDLEKDLKRDGWKYELGVKYALSLNKAFSLRPELSFSYGDIEGQSNGYLGVNGGVQLQHVQSSWVLTGQLSGFYNQYEKNHPLFDKTRQEMGAMALVQAMRLNLFGVEPLFANFVAGYAMSDANIDFFDSQTIFGLATVGIKI